MNFIKIKESNKELATVAGAAGQALINRITYAWQEDLWLRRKWSLSEQDTKELYMKEICFEINDEQIELLHPVMEEEPKCQVTFGQGNLETLSLILKFKLSDMKVNGTMRTYSSSKPCKSLPYELILKDVEFEVMAGLLIRGDSFHIENFSHDYTNFNVTFSYKNKDDSKEIFPLDKIEDSALRKSIEKYIVDKLSKDIVIAVEDSVGEECADTSVSAILNNENSYRNELRLHRKKMMTAFQKFIDEMIEMVNNELDNKKLSEVALPNLSGKLMNKESERGIFKATDGSLKSLSSLQQYGYSTVHENEDIILFIPLFFSYLAIVYKNLSMNTKDEENARSFETPENSNSSYIKIKIHKENDGKLSLTLLDYKVYDLGYIEINWVKPSNDPRQKSVEPEFAMWLNYTLEYKVTPIIEKRIKDCLNEVLKNEKLASLLLHEENIDVYDSDPLEDDNDEMEENEDDEEDEAFKEDEEMEDDSQDKKANNGDHSNHN